MTMMNPYYFTTSVRQCACGKPLQGKQEACPACSPNRARVNARLLHDVKFCAVDGESVNIEYDDGTIEHRYVMLSVGDRTLWLNGNELTHREILPFLYSCYEPDVTYIGFFLSYDFTLWFKSLPERAAYMLFGKGAELRKPKHSSNPIPFPVYADGWDIDALGMRRIKLRPHAHYGKGKCTRCGATYPGEPAKAQPWLYINDTGAYHQTSFLNVINPAKWPHDKPCSEAEYEIIKAGKAERGTTVKPGDISYYDDMVRYNRLENTILERVTETLNSGFVDIGVKLDKTSWYGPGQAVQKWLDKQSGTIKSKDLHDMIPSTVFNMGREAYYGGHFEIYAHGHLPGITFEYDITSAYPHIMRNLPCLCGRWVTGIHEDAPIAFVRATVSNNGDIGGLPYRTTDSKILYPRGTWEGVYSWGELQAAQHAGLITLNSINEAVSYTGCSLHPNPLAGIETLFQDRLAYGKESARGKALKLVYNSGYGKMAQSVGAPKYANSIYASLITSGCRTMIINAIGAQPDKSDVVMVATDGIYLRQRSTYLDALVGHDLGQWECAEKHNLTLMKPGVYWHDGTREALKARDYTKIKSRGVSGEALGLNITQLDDAFTTWANNGAQGEAPTMTIRIPFNITSPSLALARNKWHTCGNVTTNTVRTESANPNPKRCTPYLDGHGIIRSWPAHASGTSQPYKHTFGWDADLGLDQDGNINQHLADMLHGVI